MIGEVWHHQASGSVKTWPASDVEATIILRRSAQRELGIVKLANNIIKRRRRMIPVIS